MVTSAVLGMGFGLGVVLTVLGVVGSESSGAPGPAQPRLDAARAAAERAGLRVAVGVAAAVGAFLVTGWLVGSLLVGLAAVTIPSVVGRRDRRAATVARTEAIAAWAEMLRDTMAGAAGVEEAISATAPLAPAPIRAEVQTLAARLERGRLAPALRAFADELAEPTADLVVASLLLATEHQATDLGGLLGALATSARRDAALSLQVAAGRSRVRTAARVVTATTLGFAGVLVVFNRPFLEPYDDALGQAWLLVVGTIFAAAFWKLQRMSRLSGPPRLLAGRTPTRKEA